MKRLLGIWFLLLPLFTIAQLKYDANWTCGQNIGIDFSNPSGPLAYGIQTNNLEANASISDSLGNLLLYLHCPDNELAIIKDVLNDTIQGGEEINIAGSAINGALFLPFTQTSDSIYLFHIGKESQFCNRFICYKLYFTIVVKNSLGKWFVSSKNNLLSTGYVEESITAIKHSDGKTWWVIVHEQRQNVQDSTSNRFEVFHVKNNSISILSQTTNSFHTKLVSYTGELLVFNNGKSVVDIVSDDNMIYLYSFDRCSGAIVSYDSIKVNLQDEYIYSGAIDYPKLYISYLNWKTSSGTGGILQYDLTDLTINPKIIFAEQAIGFLQGQLELAPDGNIWVSNLYRQSDSSLIEKYQKHLSIIRYPETDSAIYKHSYFFVGNNAKASLGLPNFPNYSLGPEGVFLAYAGKDTVLCNNTNSSGVTIGAPPVPNVTYMWQPAAGLSATTIAQPTANPTQSMWYYLTATDTTANSCAVNTDSVYVKVETCTGINETPAAERWDYRLKPNLFHGGKTATINLALEETGTVEIYNIQGALVGSYTVEQGKNVLTLDKALSAAGVYIYKVYTGNQLRHTDKLVVVE